MKKSIITVTNIFFIIGFGFGISDSFVFIKSNGYLQNKLFATAMTAYINLIPQSLLIYITPAIFICFALLINTFTKPHKIFKIVKFLFYMMSILNILYLLKRLFLPNIKPQDYSVFFETIKAIFQDLSFIAALVIIIIPIGFLIWSKIKSSGKSETYRSKYEFDKLFNIIYKPLVVISITCITGYALLAAVSCVLIVINRNKVKNKPNVIIIMIDTLRRDYVGCYNPQIKFTPNIDKFASDACVFDCISQAPWTTASVTSFMSSKYMRISYHSSGETIMPGVVATMPEYFKELGFKTSFITSNPNAGKRYNMDKGCDYFDECYESIAAPEVLKKSQQRINGIKNQPFFIFSLFIDPHSPYFFHKEFAKIAQTPRGMAQSISVNSTDTDNPTLDKIISAKALYRNEIAFTDHYVGKYIEYLKKSGVYDKSLIIILADHGEEFYEHKVMGHGSTLYDSAIRVPFIVKLPNQKTSKRIDGNFSLIDLLPSILTTLRYNTGKFPFQGKSIDFYSARTFSDHPIYSSTLFANKNLQSLRSSKMKYIHDSNNDKQLLFNLDNDSAELTNIAEKDKELIRNLTEIMQEYNDLSLQASNSDNTKPVQTSDKEKERLKSLGYLQ
jgi:arylsulfatase A-like enzyme